MGKNLGQLVIAAGHGGPKALDLGSFGDRSMEVALWAVGAMLAAAPMASPLQLLRLSWTASLLGLPMALVGVWAIEFLDPGSQAAGAS
jgi:hypothetical protein